MTRAGLIPLLVLLLVAPGRVGAWVSNCTTDIGATRGKFLLAVFKDESSGTPVYNLYFDADLDEYSGTAPDTINIVQGAACDSTATAALTLPSTGWTTQTRGGRGGSHTELRVTGTVEGADATVVEALLAGVPNATVTQNVFTKVINGAKQGFQNAFGGRRRGRELAGNSAGKLTQQFLKRQRQRLAWMGAKTKALFATFIGTTDTTTDSPYAVIFTDSTTGNSWSAALTGNFGKCGGRGGRGGNGPDGDSDGPGGAGGRGGRGGRGGGRGGGY
ncbi:unnamed protein product [Closterium sp. NIES-65]|nr:unnamed protein product [Closterium sp. NIES-65]CAI6004946.1 unnamed protein product [Closterium sp. NIES-65]